MPGAFTGIPPKPSGEGRLLQVLLQQNLEQVGRRGLGLNMDHLDQIMQGSVCIELFIMLFSVKQYHTRGRSTGLIAEMA